MFQATPRRRSTGASLLIYSVSERAGVAVRPEPVTFDVRPPSTPRDRPSRHSATLSRKDTGAMLIVFAALTQSP